MLNKILIFVLGLSLLGAVSCSRNVSAVKADSIIQPIKLDGKWRLIEFKENGTQVDLKAAKNSQPKVVLEFTNETEFALTAFCNYMGGSYKVEENNRIITRVESRTVMGCASEILKKDDALVNSIDAMSKYEVKEDLIILQDESGNRLLKFSRIKS